MFSIRSLLLLSVFVAKKNQGPKYSGHNLISKNGKMVQRYILHLAFGAKLGNQLGVSGAATTAH
jgi:hypothetical protein